MHWTDSVFVWTLSCFYLGVFSTSIWFRSYTVLVSPEQQQCNVNNSSASRNNNVDSTAATATSSSSPSSSCRASPTADRTDGSGSNPGDGGGPSVPMATMLTTTTPVSPPVQSASFAIVDVSPTPTPRIQVEIKICGIIGMGGKMKKLHKEIASSFPKKHRLSGTKHYFETIPPKSTKFRTGLVIPIWGRGKFKDKLEILCMHLLSHSSKNCIACSYCC